MRPKKWHVEVDVTDRDGEYRGRGDVVDFWEGETAEISFQGELIARILPDGTIERTNANV